MICFSATLWNIWLARNNKVFNDRITGIKEIEKLIRFDASQWSIKEKVVNKSLFNLWKLDPAQAYSNHRDAELRRKLSIWFNTNKLVGFIDRALTRDPYDHKHAGGFIIDQQSKVWFIFAGPSHEQNPFSIEKHALSVLLEALLSKGYGNLEIIIDSDSQVLVNTYNSSSLAQQPYFVQLDGLKDKLKGTKLTHIGRKFNTVADRLASEGKYLKALRACWV